MNLQNIELNISIVSYYLTIGDRQKILPQPFKPSTI